MYLSNNTSKRYQLNAFLVSDQAGWLQLIFEENDASDVWQLWNKANLIKNCILQQLKDSDFDNVNFKKKTGISITWGNILWNRG